MAAPGIDDDDAKLLKLALTEAACVVQATQKVDAASSRVWQSEKATASRFYFDRDNHRVEALPRERLIELLKKYGRLH